MTTSRSRRALGIAALAGALAALGPAGAAAQEPAKVPIPSLLAPDFLLSVGRIMEPEPAERASTVLGTEREGAIQDRSLTTFDHLFVPLVVEGRPIDMGDEVQLYRLDREVTDPETGEPLGRVTVPTGVGRIDSLAGETARALVVEAYAPIQIGDRVRAVAPADTVWSGPPPGAPRGVSGYVIAFQEDKAVHPSYDTLFLRLPGAAALVPGEVVAVYRPGPERRGRRLPDIALGRAMVVRVDGDVAAAVLVEAYRSDLQAGDRFRQVANEP